MSETLDYRLGLVPEIRLPIGADFAVEFTFTGLTLAGYTGNFTARKSNRKSTNPYFWSSSTVTIGANSASVSFAADDEDANDKPFSTVATLNGTDYALTLYDDGAIVLRLQGKITWIDRTGAFEAVTPANASFAVAVGESVAITVTVTMASEGGAFDLPAAIHAATAATEISDADEFPLAVSPAWGLKKTAWSLIKSTLLAYFDTLYSRASAIASAISSAISTHAGLTTGVHGLGTASQQDVGAFATAAQGALAASAVQPNTNVTFSKVTVPYVDLERPFDSSFGGNGFRILTRAGHNMVIEDANGNTFAIMRFQSVDFGSRIGLSSSNFPYSPNCGISAIAAGELEINSGTTGQRRDLKLRNLTISPSASVTPAVNGELSIEATSNTSVTIKLKGSDGTVRSVALTLS
jgi:hypothetical protein